MHAPVPPEQSAGVSQNGLHTPSTHESAAWQSVVAPHIAYGPAGPSGTHAVRPLGSATSHFDAPRQPHCGSVSQAPPGTGGVQDPEGGGGGGGGGGAGATDDDEEAGGGGGGGSFDSAGSAVP